MKNTKVSIFKNLFDTDVPHHRTLEMCLSRIKLGKSKDKIEKIQSTDDKNLKSELKKKLPSICFNGTFRERNKSGLIEHSGLMILDYDNVNNPKILKKQLQKIPYLVSCFISPSGNGVKALIKIPKDFEKHHKYFKKFEEDYPNEYLDQSGKDVSRVCFESYDPNIYINYDAKEYNPQLEERGHSVIDKVPTVKIEDQDKIIKMIMEWNWATDFVEGQRNEHIFNIASAFCDYGVDQYNAEGYILNNIIHGDFKENEAKTAIKSAYKSRSFGTKYFEDYSKIDQIKNDLKNGKTKVIEKYKIDEQTFDQISEEVRHEDFWYYEENSKGQQKIKIDSLKYKLFLERNGFKKHFPNNSQKASFVQIESNKVKETSTEIIKDFVLDYLMERKEIDIWNYCSTYLNLFSENYLNMLETITLTMLNDTRTVSYLAFKNGVLKVDKNTVELIDYIDIDLYIWERQIIQRDYIQSKSNDNDYKSFIKNISHESTEPIESVIGYLLCTYKTKRDNKAIIFNDEVISQNPEGGTGKGLLIQGLRHIRQVSILDGKAFDDKKSFPYQTVNQETQVLIFDDVKKNFDFESKFSLVTEGMTLERKNKDAIKLSVEESPKIAITTNYAIKGEGNSHNRRRHEVEIAQYYGGGKEPFDDFGRNLFDDWDEDDFIRFDNYMIYCLQLYLKTGLIHQNARNLKKRKFVASTSMEWVEYCEEDNLKLNKRIDKKQAFNDFVDEYPDFKKWFTQRRFTSWVQKWATYLGFEYTDGITQGMQWFELKGSDENINKLDDIWDEIENKIN